MSHTLVDIPVTPYSTTDDIRAWVRECSVMVEKNPDDSGWLDALNEAKELEILVSDKA